MRDVDVEVWDEDQDKRGPKPWDPQFDHNVIKDLGMNAYSGILYFNGSGSGATWFRKINLAKMIWDDPRNINNHFGSEDVIKAHLLLESHGIGMINKFVTSDNREAYDKLIESHREFMVRYRHGEYSHKIKYWHLEK